MGESVIEATVSRWIKQTGDTLVPGEAVVELETDKINLEVGSPQAGILSAILHQVGDTVAVGDVLATVTAQAESMPEKTKSDLPGATIASQADRPAGSQSAQATPVAQRMAQDLGVDLNKVTPTGSGGRITKEDIQAYAAQPQQDQGGPTRIIPPQAVEPAQTGGSSARSAAQPPALPPSTSMVPGEISRVRTTRRRQTIVRRLVEAQHTAAMLTTCNEVDMSAVIDLRKRRRESFKERFGVDLGFMPFFVKASIGALKSFPYLNAEIAPAENGGEEIILKHYFDIGIAIGAEEGLVVPVIRGADRLSFAQIEKAIREYASKAKDNALTLDDLRGGTFTITNGGVFGSLLSTPILNPPQVGILGVHKIQERPVVDQGEIVIRPMMYLALSYDHRIVDGREAVQFLVRLKELVEDPEALLLG